MIQPFRPVYPVSPLLQKYVYCFYGYESKDEQYSHIHYSLPHVYNAVSIYSGATIELAPKLLSAYGDSHAKPVCIIQGKQQASVKAELKGRLQRVTILFKPLGLNHFIIRPLDKVMDKNSRFFTEWDSLDFEKIIHHLFAKENAIDRLDKLESFLCSIYRNKNTVELEQALEYMNDMSSELSVGDIAKLIALPLRTFNRLFHSELGVSPVTHRRILRFRQSLESKVFDDRLRSLTEVSYRNGFYDQSEFIKLYKQMSGAAPSTLLNTVKKIGDSKLLFQYPKTKTG